MESRFAHTEGKCCLVYVSGGEVITAGADGEVIIIFTQLASKSSYL